MSVDDPQHGDRATCKTCGGRINYIEYTQSIPGPDEYEVLDAWWAHNRHPADNHEAEPEAEA